MSKKGLGRSFDSLIPTDLLDESFDPTADQDQRSSELRFVRLEQILVDPDQPRKKFDQEALTELAASIKEHGLLQPLVVVVKGKKYQIVAGERRFRAASLVPLEKVPVIVRSLSDQHRLEVSLIENIQRRDLSPIETATAYAKLRDQFNLGLDEIGARVGGRSASAISNTLRLLRLPKNVQNALQDGQITEGQARPLVGLDEEVVDEMLPRIIRDGWSARMIERQAQNAKVDKKTVRVIEKAAKQTSYTREAILLGERLKAPVNVNVTSKGAGTIIIKFKDNEEFERIKKVFNVDES